MANYVRNNAWNDGGDFSNSDLFWYAKGVGKMMSRSLDDTASWWFFAAIHGEYVDPNNAWYPPGGIFPAWGTITGPPTVPTTPLPPQATMDQYWNQCQHATWYFLPWHRGYLLALEAQLRQDIVSLGGPDTWALPYWNYFGGTAESQKQLPPAFAQPALPDGSPNPLYVAMRYGPRGGGNVYMPVTPQGPVNEQAMGNTVYTGSNSQTPSPGFGGGVTGFAHFGNATGNIENNPHNLGHNYIGGPGPTQATYGIMADPGTAALDPIFYLHHSNIDRLWAAWNALGNANPTDAAWVNGPAQQFVMPVPGGQPWYYTPGYVSDLQTLDYTYQELTTSAAAPAVAARISTLRGAALEAAPAPMLARVQPRKTELIGAGAAPLVLRGGAGQTDVPLDTRVQAKAMRSMKLASTTSLPDQAFLKLENVRGTADATVIGVYVSPANGGARVEAGAVGLFGLRRASLPDGQHGGEGLTFTLDITPVLDQLHLDSQLDASALHVEIVPDMAAGADDEITIGRVSIFREAF